MWKESSLNRDLSFLKCIICISSDQIKRPDPSARIRSPCYLQSLWIRIILLNANYLWNYQVHMNSQRLWIETWSVLASTVKSEIQNTHYKTNSNNKYHIEKQRKYHEEWRYRCYLNGLLNGDVLDHRPCKDLQKRGHKNKYTVPDQGQALKLQRRGKPSYSPSSCLSYSKQSAFLTML